MRRRVVQMVPVSEKLLAIICNDQHLQGSYQLEGISFVETIAFLLQYLKIQPESRANQHIAKLMVAFEQMHLLAEKISKLHTTKNADTLAKELMQAILKLDEHDYFLMPGGWLNVAGGHALVYRFERGANPDDFLFSVYNSGMGLDYHPNHAASTKKMYDPVLTYRFSTSAKQDFRSVFQSFLIDLLMAQNIDTNRGDRVVGVDQLYQKIFPRLLYFDGSYVERQPKQCVEQYTAGQVSGTCAQRVLHQLLKECFADIDVYREFIYRFKKYSVDQYYNDTVLRPGRVSVLIKAIQHLLRLLDMQITKGVKKPLFDARFIAEQQQDLQKKLDQISRLETAASTESDGSTQWITPKSAFQLSFPNEGLLDSQLLTPSSITQWSELPRLAGGLDLLKEMRALDAQMQRVSSAANHPLVIAAFESFVRQLPIEKVDVYPVSFYRGVNSRNQLMEFLQVFSRLQGYYATACHAFLNEKYVLPRMYLMATTILVVLDRLLRSPSLAMGEPCFFDIMRNGSSLFNFMLAQSKKSVFLATNNLADDLRSQIIGRSCNPEYNYVGTGFKPNIALMSHYQSIIDQEQSEKQKLVEKFRQHSLGLTPGALTVLRANNLQALYSYQKEKELGRIGEYPLLASRFSTQVQLEQFIVQQAQLAEGLAREVATGADFKIEADGDEIKCSSPLIKRFFQSWPNLPEKITHAVYSPARDAILPSLARDVQLFPQRDDNAIYTVSVNQTSPVEVQELELLRRVKDAQLSLILDYFIRSLEKLSRVDMQNYLEAALFEPGLLCNIYADRDKIGNLFKQFDCLIESSLVFFTPKNQVTLPVVYVLRLSYLMYYYFMSTNDPCYQERMIALYYKIANYIAHTAESDVLIGLHRYQFLVAVAILRHCRITNATLCHQVALSAWVSLFYLKATKNQQGLDVNSEFELEQTMARFLMTQAEGLLTVTADVVLNILTQWSISELGGKKLVISGNYPRYQIQAAENDSQYEMDFTHGYLTQNQMVRVKTPMGIQTHPILPWLGIEKAPEFCFIKPHSSTVYLTVLNNTFRFVADRGIYWRHHERTQGEWYQLLLVTSEQAEFFRVNFQREASFSGLPEIFFGLDYLFWAKTGIHQSRLLVTDHQHRVVYEGRQQTRSTWCFYDTEGYGQLVTQLTDRTFSSIEDAGLTLRLQSLDNKQIKVVLPRYQLAFERAVDSGAPYEWEWQGRRLQLQPTQLNSVIPGVACLVFTDQKDSYVLMPIQPFVNGDDRNSGNEYYQLHQDLRGFVPQHQLKKKDFSWKKIWRYHASERFMVLPLINGEPRPQTVEEGLYLAYLYLCQHQPEKAWNILTDCETQLGGLVGTFAEQVLLYWICQWLPYCKDDEKKAQLKTPAVVACQLKAMAMVTKYGAQPWHHRLHSASVTVSQAPWNSQYAELVSRDVRVFFANLGAFIVTQYLMLQVMRRELPGRFSLHQFERTSLLTYCDRLEQLNRHGSLKAELAELKFATLAGEWASFSGDNPSPYDNARKEAITRFITEHPGVSGIGSELVLTSTRGAWTIDGLAGKYHHCYDSAMQLKQEVDFFNIQAQVASLNLSQSEEGFRKIFPNLLALVLSTSTEPSLLSLREQLKRFCISILTASEEIPIDQQDSRSTLCQVLYQLMHIEQISSRERENLKYHLSSCFSGTAELLRRRGSMAPIELMRWVEKEELLVSAQTLWHAGQAQQTQDLPIRNPSGVTEVVLFTKNDTPTVMESLPKWHSLQAQFSAVDSDLDEYTAGNRQYHLMQQMQQFATNLFTANANSHLLALTDALRLRLERLDNQQRALQEEILRKVHDGPKDSALRLVWQREVASLKRDVVTWEQLLGLFGQASTKRYQSVTGLTVGECEQLHGMLTTYVAHGLVQQQLGRVYRCVTGLPSDASPQDYYRLAESLFSRNTVDINQEPTRSLFQYQNDLLLRPQQVAVLGRFLIRDAKHRFSERVERMLMGGGKSKVILPLLAQQKADGRSLIIIEVPRALLRTNYCDLEATSSRQFDQHAHLLEFNRDSDCSPEALETLFNYLTDIMVQKDYVVTTGDVLQSLELKYLEFLARLPAEKEPDSTAAQQVMVLEKILCLLRQRGDLIIDEVHQGLWIKNKLNYTLGNIGHLSKSLIQGTLELYQFFMQVSLDDILEKKGCSLLDLVTNYKLLDNKAQLQAVAPLLVRALITSASSPIKGIVSQWCRDEANGCEQLSAYLLEQRESVPEWILQKANKKQKDNLALLKELVNRILPFTLERHPLEHYGPSHRNDLDARIRALAIPYVANNVPNERSRFGNDLVALCHTIQSLLIHGVDEDILRIFIEDLQSAAQKERIRYKYSDINQTAAAKLFLSLQADGAEPIAISELRLTDANQWQSLCHHLVKNQRLIFEALPMILSYIETSPAVLSSDAYHHADMVRSCQGMTGTPWNYSTYPQRMRYNKKITLGLDGYVIAALDAKKTTIRQVDFADISQFITSLFNPYHALAPLHSIIDICASFKGISNQWVATTIAQYIQKNWSQHGLAQSRIRYVLYFNKNNELSALPIQENAQPITIGTSDPDKIQLRLNCGPSSWFIYYDQAHTIGVDVKQPNNAIGIALVDDETHLSAFLQGAMRLRGVVDGAQTLEIVASSKQLPRDFMALTVLMQQKEHSMVIKDNYRAALFRMRAVIRNAVMTYLLTMGAKQSCQKKQAIHDLMASYFCEQLPQDLFTEYGAVHRKLPIKAILQRIKAKHLDSWRRFVNMVEDRELVDTERSIVLALNKVVEIACVPDVCEPQQYFPMGDQTTEVVTAKQVETATQVDKEVLHHANAPQIISYVRWFDPYGRFASERDLRLVSLSQLCQNSDGALVDIDFSPNLLVSCNFYHTFDETQPFLQQPIKLVHALLFRRCGIALQCILLTQQEAEEWMSYSFLNPDYWMSTTQGTPLKGKLPRYCDSDQSYQSLIEQAQFFNGEFKALLAGDRTYRWLSTQPMDKIAFFERYLLNHRETQLYEVSALRNVFSNITEVCNQIILNPSLDYTVLDLMTMFPDLSEKEADNFSVVAAFFKTLPVNWWLGNTQIYLEDTPIATSLYGVVNDCVDKMRVIGRLVATLSEKASNTEEYVTAWWIIMVTQPHLAALAKYFPEFSKYARSDVMHADGLINPANVPVEFISKLFNILPDTMRNARSVLYRALRGLPQVVNNLLLEKMALACQQEFDRPSSDLLESDEESHSTNEALEEQKMSVYRRVKNTLVHLKTTLDVLIEKGTPSNPQYDPKYRAAAVAANRLYASLDEHCDTFLNETYGENSVTQLRDSCKEAMNIARIELSKHRGFWYQIAPIFRTILGVLSTLTILPALVVTLTSREGYVPTFFSVPKTRSLGALEAFDSGLQDILPASECG